MTLWQNEPSRKANNSSFIFGHSQLTLTTPPKYPAFADFFNFFQANQSISSLQTLFMNDYNNKQI